MKVYNSVEEFPGLENAVVTIGTFDGVHAGHNKIIQRLNDVARETKGETVLLTFFPHPRMVLQPDDSDLKLITTMEERTLLLEKNGIHHLIVQPFSKEFSRISATEFVRDVLLSKIGMKTLVIGYDHHFGRNREGSYKELEEMASMYGFRLEEISKQVIDEVAVSSTKIRKALLLGDVEAANKLLGHDFTLRGEVIKGDRIGTSLGFPTANIKIRESYKLIPEDGIYAVMVEVDGELHKGMLYLGTRPTVDGKKHTSEVNILDFNRDIYGKTITVFLKTRIRGDMHFENLEQLKEKMKEDLQNATKLLS
ncbi:MAG: bifunctional riboflavin kinase/FAD synthetase [Bacteroidetes bacterium]|nr:bifunctional riboflavin kinase/FAD synthetase [Bacteroidota bacterium]MBL0137865.1 bifunctional riboflavin kinase/FAD synthetase [Bacteroidota bacterium]